MQTFLQQLHTTDLLILVALTGYVLVFGLGNTIKRIKAILTNDTLLQSTLGGLLDMLFCCGIIYFSVKQFVL